MGEWITPDGLPVPTPPSQERLARKREARELRELFEDAAHLGLSVMEDMMPATSLFEFDADRCEWGFEIKTQYGFPRKRLGVLVLALKDNGDIVVYIDKEG